MSLPTLSTEVIVLVLEVSMYILFWFVYIVGGESVDYVHYCIQSCLLSFVFIVVLKMVH